jgi:hypothetical protein
MGIRRRANALHHSFHVKVLQPQTQDSALPFSSDTVKDSYLGFANCSDANRHSLVSTNCTISIQFQCVRLTSSINHRCEGWGTHRLQHSASSSMADEKKFESTIWHTQNINQALDSEKAENFIDLLSRKMCFLT